MDNSNMSAMCALGILIIGLIVAVWFLVLASIALNETLVATSDSYKDAVKGISGTSIAIGSLGIIGICIFGWYNLKITTTK
jgi:hypothetical protein